MDFPANPFVAGASGPELAQRRGILGRLFPAVMASRLHSPRPGMATGNLPMPAAQRFHARSRIVDATVPSSTASDLLPNNRRPAPVWDGEPGASSPITLEDY